MGSLRSRRLWDLVELLSFGIWQRTQIVLTNTFRSDLICYQGVEERSSFPPFLKKSDQTDVEERIHISFPLLDIIHYSSAGPPQIICSHYVLVSFHQRTLSCLFVTAETKILLTVSGIFLQSPREAINSGMGEKRSSLVLSQDPGYDDVELSTM